MARRHEAQGLGASRRGDARRNDRAHESESCGLAYTRAGPRDRTNLAGEPDLAEYNPALGEGAALKTRRRGRGDRKVGGRLVDRQPAGDVYEDIAGRDGQAGPPL